jgi:hypothetical protein
MAKCMPRKIKLWRMRSQQIKEAIVTMQVTLPVSSVYKIRELITWFMLANPVFLLPRKIHMTVVMRTSTEADRVTPVVKIHAGYGLMNKE